MIGKHETHTVSKLLFRITASSNSDHRPSRWGLPRGQGSSPRYVDALVDNSSEANDRNRSRESSDNAIVDCRKLSVLHTSETEITNCHARKKNQDKGELEGKRKAKGDDVVREMYD